MLKIKNILAPVDFSELSDTAAQYASALARQFDSRLILAHAFFWDVFKYTGLPGSYITQLPSPRDEVIPEAKRLLECLAGRVSPGRAVETIVLEGDPAREIVRFARENQVDLIVMPTHGYGPVRRFILGSVTAKILHDANCPVFTSAHVAEPPLKDPRHYRRVACAVDFGPHSETVLRWAAGFAAACGAQMDVIHAAPFIKLRGRELVEMRAALLSAVSEDMGKLLQTTGCTAGVHAESAEVTTYVPEVTASIAADLLVIGRTTKKGVSGWLGATTYALIRASPCPVVSV